MTDSISKYPKAGSCRRPGAIAKRWLDIVLYAIFGGAFVGIMAEISAGNQLEWLTWNEGIFANEWIRCAIQALGWALLLSADCLRTTFSCRQFARIRYPSCLGTVLLAYFAIIAIFLGASVFDQDIIFHLATPVFISSLVAVLAPLISFIVGIIIKDFALRLYHYRRQKTKPTKNEKAHHDWLPKDLQWILNETPVPDDGDDKFNFIPTYTRLADTISHIDGNAPPTTIGLVGPYGSGKTSTTHSVETLTHQKRKDIHFVLVPAWGIAEHGLTGFVLQRMVSKLEELGIDCLAIRGIPTHYLAAIKVVNDKAGTLAELFCAPTSSPNDVLAKCQHVLEALGIFLVVCIQDAERNGSRKSLQELAGLLDRFRTMPNVTFIVEANENTHERIDLSRICDYIERMPTMPYQDTKRWLLEFRKACSDFSTKRTTEYSSQTGKNDACHDRNTEKTIELPRTHSMEAELCSTDSQREITKLLGTPRVFKHGLRNICVAWEKLHGEVDLDELIWLNILRCVAPEAWEFIVRNIDKLRSIDQPDQDAANKLVSDLVDDWHRTTQKVDNSTACQLLLKIIGINLVDLDNEGRKQTISVTMKCPQSIFSPQYGSTYFTRIMTISIDQKGLRDQTILRWISEWKSGNKAALLDSLFNDNKGLVAEKVFQFRTFLSDDEHNRMQRELDLCTDYITKALHIFGRNANKKSIDTKFINDFFNDVIGGGNEYSIWIRERIKQAIDYSLRMAYDLYISFSSILHKGQKDLLHYYMNLFWERLRNDPDYLGRVLNPEDQTMLWHLIFLSKYTATRFSECLSHIISSAEQTPLIVVPHLVHLIATVLEHASKTPKENPFSLEFLNQLNPSQDDLRSLRNVLQKYCDNPDAKPEIIERIKSVLLALGNDTDIRDDLPTTPEAPNDNTMPDAKTDK
ncbi:P-loop NTPase fold protein [Oligosphaera ethanolica]|uniref:KAP NTPase domain-containing protein n=1 Tax=Oligosphaera ethanolica TaxID=760260 RepID=A0AAE4API1_9BACT|nr:P-loop NTPase fold protein [Oligosphaera ethanolica]MDQ0290008.1 hypothetical protein [Oligosphaera ethanolica]